MDPHILIVDDERAITDLVGIYLQNEGCRVTLAYNGADAAKAILEQDFDLAVLDIMLPDIDGFELLRTIRAEHTYPVIMLTARGSQNDKIEGLSLGADGSPSAPSSSSRAARRSCGATPATGAGRPRRTARSSRWTASPSTRIRAR